MLKLLTFYQENFWFIKVISINIVMFEIEIKEINYINLFYLLDLTPKNSQFQIQNSINDFSSEVTSLCYITSPNYIYIYTKCDENVELLEFLSFILPSSNNFRRNTLMPTLFPILKAFLINIFCYGLGLIQQYAVFISLIMSGFCGFLEIPKAAKYDGCGMITALFFEQHLYMWWNISWCIIIEK